MTSNLGVSVSDSSIFDPSPLIEHMVNLAVLIKDEIAVNQDKEILNIIQSDFKNFLKVKLNFDEFAEIYAQCFVYGLFSAKIMQKGKITLENVPTTLGKANPLLRKVFVVFNQDISSIFDHKKNELNTFIEFLNQLDFSALINWFSKANRKSNPVIHFYESFLADYDPQLKLKRGVFYTPDTIVSFIIRSVNILLKDSLRFSDGLNDPSAIILDPAMGTGTFLNEIVRIVKENFEQINMNTSQEKRITEWNRFINSNLLKRVFGFEVMIIPYIVAHLQLALLLEATGYDFAKYQNRIGVFLTNSLEGTNKNKSNLTKYLRNDLFSSEETDLMNEVKINTPISVIVGNPPYSKFSSNKECHWIEGLMKGTISDGARRSSYYEIDGEPLQERKTHLLDDYVKFIRFAQWRIEKTGYGIVAFITNHGFLSNPTFRGMRQQLLEAFDQLYILDLHGNILKGETSPDGSKDENVFDIKQGTSIIFMIKKKKKDHQPQMFHFDLWGTRNNKYKYLQDNDVSSVNWIQIFPRTPDYFFYPIDWTLWEEYKKGWKLTDIFSDHGVGIVTARDKLTIHPTEEDIWNTVIDFGTLSADEARKKYRLGKDAESWRVVSAQNDLRKIGLDKAVSRKNGQIKIIDETFTNQLKEQYIKPVNYRPFNKKYTFYTGNSNGFLARPVYSIMKHLLQEDNLSLITTRLTKGEEFKHVFVSNILFEQIFLSSKTSNSAYSFPLYITSQNDDELRDNISQQFIHNLSSHWNLTYLDNPANEGELVSNFSSKDIFHYIYAILHSEIYRNRYKNFLGLDFPRIPFSANLDLVRELVSNGKELVQLHLMDITNKNIILEGESEFHFSKASDIMVKNKRKKKYKSGKLYLNDEYYVDGISEKVYKFHIGGYPIIEKWIRENNNKLISSRTIRILKNIISIIKVTLALSDQIDKVIRCESSFLKSNY